MALGLGEIGTPIYSPVSESLYPLLTVLLLSIGLLLTASFFIYEVTSTKLSRSLVQEFATGDWHPSSWDLGRSSCCYGREYMFDALEYLLFCMEVSRVVESCSVQTARDASFMKPQMLTLLARKVSSSKIGTLLI